MRGPLAVRKEIVILASSTVIAGYEAALSTPGQKALWFSAQAAISALFKGVKAAL